MYNDGHNKTGYASQINNMSNFDGGISGQVEALKIAINILKSHNEGDINVPREKFNDITYRGVNFSPVFFIYAFDINGNNYFKLKDNIKTVEDLYETFIRVSSYSTLYL